MGAKNCEFSKLFLMALRLLIPIAHREFVSRCESQGEHSQGIELQFREF